MPSVKSYVMGLTAIVRKILAEFPSELLEIKSLLCPLSSNWPRPVSEAVSVLRLVSSHVRAVKASRACCPQSLAVQPASVSCSGRAMA